MKRSRRVSQFQLEGRFLATPKMVNTRPALAPCLSLQEVQEQQYVIVSLPALKVTEASSARISNNGWRTASTSFFLELPLPLADIVYDLFTLLISSF